VNSIEVLLVDLVQMAESPLYSAYRWLGRQLGRDISIGEFLRLVDALVQRDVLRLWSIDPQSQTRTRLHSVPRGLEQQYIELETPDATFDPFALSLTLGSAADPAAAPDWEVDFDFMKGTFRVRATHATEASAMLKLAELFPDVLLVEEGRSERPNDSVELFGSLTIVSHGSPLA
jgi:hypothetical protein